MRIIEDWQYKYIEKSLYNYDHLNESGLPTEHKMKQAIEAALVYFNGTIHERMISEFYFKVNKNLNRYGTNDRYYEWICDKELFVSRMNGYVVRREIIYRIAMNCYIQGLFIS